MTWPFRSHAARLERVRTRFDRFRGLLELNASILQKIAEAEEMIGGEYVFDRRYLEELTDFLTHGMAEVVLDLNAISGNRYLGLVKVVEDLRTGLDADLAGQPAPARRDLVIPLDEVGREMAEQVGHKAARLADLRRRLDLGIPPGFVVTAEAGRLHLRDAGVPESGGSEDEAHVRAVRESAVPKEVDRAIRRAVASLEKQAGSITGLAIRSSAIGEDGRRSFAGQYSSLLNVPPDGVADAWREVMASFFAPGVAAYRERLGDAKPASGMAVLVLPMVPARAAGVLYSLDPAEPDGERMMISAAPGLGPTVVGGGAADRFLVSREPPFAVLERRLQTKPTQLRCAPDGGTVEVPIPEAERDEPALAEADLSRLAETALLVERVVRFPLDMEWVVTEAGELRVLQVRPVHFPPLPPASRDLAEEARLRHRVLMEGAGEVASRGIGAGPVRHVAHPTDCDRFPPGAVLVSREPSPLLSACVARASAVVTDVGAAASHLGTVARELRVPALFGTGDATRILAEGTAVTVDSEDGVIYEGEVRELLRHELLKTSPGERSPEFRTLRRMLRRIAPLNLVDPAAKDFTPEGCRTCHDLLRFAHEKAVEEISTGIRSGTLRRGHLVKELDLPIRLDLVLVDIGGGLAESKAARIGLEGVECRPLRRLLCGLTEPGVWATDPSDLDLRGFVSSALRSGDLLRSGNAKVERNVAVVGRDYLNLNLKLGYHFNVLDCRLGDRPERNHLYFFFVGGVTEIERRARRASLLSRILSARGFTVESRGDLVVGRLSRISREALEDTLVMAGRLIGFTRQLDVLLRSDGVVDEYVWSFLEGRARPGEVEGDLTGTEEIMDGAIEVLVLDDEVTVCQRLEEYLTGKGFRVETFTESRAALERLEGKVFDVIVTDLKMQKPDGMEVFRTIRERGLPTQVIMISAYASIESFRTGEYTGLFEFVTKPFRMSDIAKLVRRAARKRRRQPDSPESAGGGST